MSPDLILHLIIWPPLAGFLINGILGGKLPKWLVTTIGCAMPLTSFIGTLLAYNALADKQTTVSLYTWFVGEGSAKVDFAFLFDNLSLLMLFVVTGVGTLIHVYSAGYMHDDKGYSRFFAYMNFFMFSMLLLVLGDNLIVLFAGWEGVGLCSFLLIGFWFENQDYNKAASKAFIMNRIGDLAFLIAIFMTIYTTGGVRFLDIKETLGEEGVPINSFIMIVIGSLFLIGVTGKSAQIPLFTWLPDAMAGPTPVSALIHAATMVTAGVYLIARMYFLFDTVPVLKTVIAILGCLTAFVAASIALKQNDIKKVLAYSTVSQLGYMVAALGVGAYTTAVFHLMTHAFFKALLFLGAGSVIHGLHGEQDLRNMGGLKTKMKATYFIMLIGTLAIIGCPPFAGFFSKDEILAAVYAGNFWVFLVLAFASVMTAWYMLRMFYATFHGKYRGSEESFHHIHESPWIMLIPLFVLSVLSMVGGFAGLPEITGQTHMVFQFLNKSIAQTRFEVSHLFDYCLWGLTIVTLLVIFFLTWRRYGNWNTSVESAGSNFVAKTLQNKYYLDEIYEWLLVKPIKRTGTWFMNFFEFGVVDRLVQLPTAFIHSGSNAIRYLQNGNLSSYLLYSVVALAALLVFFMII